MADQHSLSPAPSEADLEEAIEAFRANLRGELLQPGDDSYDGARLIWNGMFDKKPALIARCSGTADVCAPAAITRPGAVRATAAS